MRHYCLGGRSAPSVCARRSRPVRGASGRHLASCLFRFPLPAPRVPRCVWRAVPSGCPLPSLASTPFHAVCAFRALGPVALPVVPACPFRVCALALSRCPLPPPLGGVARASRVVPALGAGRAVPRGPCPSACPAPVPCSVWRAWGGTVRSRFPPTWLGVVGAAAGRPRGGAFDRCVGRLGSCAPAPPTARPLGGLSGSALWARVCGCGGPVLSLWGLRAAGRAHGVLMLGGGLGGGGGACAVSSGCAAGAGPVGRGVALPLSVPLPSLGRQQSGRHWRCAVHGGRGPPYHSGSCSPGFSGYDLCGVPVRRRGPACSSRPPCEPAAGAGGRVTLLLPSRAGGGPSPLPRGVGAGAPAAVGLVGGRGGGVAPRPPCSRSGRLPAVLLSGPLRVAGALPSGARVRSGLKCRSGVGGGVRGGPWIAPLGAPADLNPPSVTSEWAVVTGGSCGVRPPSCSVVRVAPARRCGFAGAGPAAVALTASPFLLRGGAPPRPWGGGGPRLWLPS